MVRKTYTRHISHSAKLYQQRSSMYVRRSLDGQPKLQTLLMEIRETPTPKTSLQFGQKIEPQSQEPLTAKVVPKETFIFPAKPPTPSIVKRTNGVMPHQRIRTSL